jgi:hypothetical protein
MEEEKKEEKGVKVGKGVKKKKEQKKGKCPQQDFFMG